MRFDLANLPNNIDTLRGMIVTQAANFAAELGARETELATAKAGLLAKTLEIEKLKLHIARLRRAQFGRSSEKIARTLEQLELMLEDLEADTSVPAASATSLAADVEQSSSMGASRWPSICRAKRSCTSRAAPVHHAAARCARWART